MLGSVQGPEVKIRRLNEPCFLPPATEVWEGYVFTPVCHSVHRGRGVCMAGGGGHVWQGRHGGGVVWQGGMRGGGHAWWGAMHGRGVCGGEACMAGGIHGTHAPGSYYDIRSIPYASYWNAFLFLFCFRALFCLKNVWTHFLTFPIFSQVSMSSLFSSQVSLTMAVLSIACDLLVTGWLLSCWTAISSGMVPLDSPSNRQLPWRLSKK